MTNIYTQTREEQSTDEAKKAQYWAKGSAGVLFRNSKDNDMFVLSFEQLEDLTAQAKNSTGKAVGFTIKPINTAKGEIKIINYFAMNTKEDKPTAKEIEKIADELMEKAKK